MKARKISQPLTSENVLVAYKTLRDNNFVLFDIPDDAFSKIESLVSTINANYYGYTPYGCVELQAAACLYYIVKDHVFNDGNKRTAVLTTVTFCAMNGVEITLPQDLLDALVVVIEDIKDQKSEAFIHTIAGVMFSDVEGL